MCLYVRDYLKVNVLENGIEKQEGIESKWLSVQQSHLPSFIIGCIYRHPKATIDFFTCILDTFKNMLL